MISYVLARGEILGATYVFRAVLNNDEIEIQANESEIDFLQDRFNSLLDDQPPMGGTYYPPHNTLLCAYNILQHTFFDKVSAVLVSGEIEEIPYEADVIY